MALKVYPAPYPQIATLTAAQIQWTVPGQYRWTLTTVFATLTRGAGGTNVRAPLLTVTDGTTTILGTQFLDTAADPGVISITFMDIGNVQAATYATGFASVPLPTYTLAPGYVITLTVPQSVAGDAWATGAAFVDESPQR